MDEPELYSLRWKGKILGPFSREIIQAKLQTAELSLVHEIQVQDQWMPVRKFLATNSGPPPINPAIIQVNRSADEPQVYTVRWRGKTSGPYSREVILGKLQTGELSLAHELQVGDQWQTVRRFLNQSANSQAPAQHQTPEQPKVQPQQEPDRQPPTEPVRVAIPTQSTPPRVRLNLGRTPPSILAPTSAVEDQQPPPQNAAASDPEANAQKIPTLKLSTKQPREEADPPKPIRPSADPAVSSGNPIDKLIRRVNPKPH